MYELEVFSFTVILDGTSCFLSFILFKRDRDSSTVDVKFCRALSILAFEDNDDDPE